jgi:hypothetical protein
MTWLWKHGWLFVVEMLFLKLAASTDRFFPTVLAIITVLAAYFYRAIAFPAIYRSAFSGFKRNFGGFATARTRSGEHLALGLIACVCSLISAGALSFFPCLTARGAAFRLICIAFRWEKLLFFGSECERGSAIKALDCFFLETHEMTSSFNIVRVLVISTINLLGL